MVPLPTQRWRRATAGLAIAWALLALAVSIQANLFKTGLSMPFHTTAGSGDLIVSWAAPDAARAGVSVGDRVISVDGLSGFAWTRERRWEELRAGVPNRYEFSTRDGVRYALDLEPIPATDGPALQVPIYAASLLVGAVYLGLGLLVWMLRQGRAESWAFLLMGSAMATQLFTAFETFRAPLGYERTVWNLFFLGAAIFHLFTSYPFEPRWIAERPMLRRIPYWLAAAMALPILFERQLRLPEGLLPAIGFFTAVLLSLTCVGILARERYRNREHEEADRADVMLFGALVSFVPVVVLLLLEMFTPLRFPFWTALLWFGLFPLSIAYGIVRRQLFDIRHLARSSVAYGAATVAITGLYALLVAGADALVARGVMSARSPQFSLIFLFFAILAFNPLRNRTQRIVDRVFDRDRVTYRQAVQEISEAMVSMLSVKEIVDRIVRTLTDSMGVDRAMVMLLDDGERSLRPEAAGGRWPEGAERLELRMDHPVCKLLWMRREELSRAQVAAEADPRVRDDCLQVFDRLEAALLVPVLFGVDMLGLIAVGRKLSGERFHPEDRQLLLTLANQSSIAIENAKAFDEIAKLNETLEARVEERTAELRDTQAQLTQAEKMKSLGQLVAGVAHELNNPIGFVHANLQLLDEYIRKLVDGQRSESDTQRAQEAITKLLERSREGTQRVKKIVQDLRTFSRMDQAELQDADLHEEIGRTLRLMEPRLKDNIKVELDFGEIPRVRCYAGQLNQVFLNLLMNACDAIGRDGTVLIRTRPIQGGVRLEFRDDGPGISDEVRSRIFDPFFTTKPVGVGTGLGLSLSHGIIERHDGRIWVESEPGQGTAFFVELPLDATPPEGDR